MSLGGLMQLLRDATQQQAMSNVTPIAQPGAMMNVTPVTPQGPTSMITRPTAGQYQMGQLTTPITEQGPTVSASSGGGWQDKIKQGDMLSQQIYGVPFYGLDELQKQDILDKIVQFGQINQGMNKSEPIEPSQPSSPDRQPIKKSPTKKKKSDGGDFDKELEKKKKNIIREVDYEDVEKNPKLRGKEDDWVGEYLEMEAEFTPGGKFVRFTDDRMKGMEWVPRKGWQPK